MQVSLTLQICDRPRPAVTVETRAGSVAEFVSSALRLDPLAIERGLERMRRQHPEESDRALARRCVEKAAWLAAGTSFVLGLPDHPGLAIPAAMLETVLLRQIQRVTMAQIAFLHEERILGEGLDPAHVLKAVLGGHCAAEVTGSVVTEGGRKALVSAARHVAELDGVRAVSRVLELAGMRAPGWMLLVKAVPVAGAVVAGLAAAKAVRRETERAMALLEPVPAPAARAEAPVAALETRTPSGSARRAAIQVVAAGIRASDVLVGATRRSRAALSAFLAEARARARPAPVANAVMRAAA